MPCGCRVLSVGGLELVCEVHRSSKRDKRAKETGFWKNKFNKLLWNGGLN